MEELSRALDQLLGRSAGPLHFSLPDSASVLSPPGAHCGVPTRYHSVRGNPQARCPYRQGLEQARCLIVVEGYAAGHRMPTDDGWDF